MALRARFTHRDAGSMFHRHVTTATSAGPAGHLGQEYLGGLADPSVPMHACCCPARPMYKVVMPPTADRPHPVDLWLCGHHCHAFWQALAASGVHVCPVGRRTTARRCGPDRPVAGAAQPRAFTGVPPGLDHLHAKERLWPGGLGLLKALSRPNCQRELNTGQRGKAGSSQPRNTDGSRRLAARRTVRRMPGR